MTVSISAQFGAKFQWILANRFVRLASVDGNDVNDREQVAFRWKQRISVLRVRPERGTKNHYNPIYLSVYLYSSNNKTICNTTKHAI